MPLTFIKQNETSMKHKLLSVFVFLFAATMFSYGQRTVSGVVTSGKDKQPLIGAVVLVEKTTIGTTTDIDGKYSLSVPDDAKNLLISYTGFKNQTVLITSTTLNIALEENEKLLDDVVVTALGIKREKKALGYSVQDVKAEELTKGGNPNALSALSGKVAGLQITTSSGQPGAAVNLKLRGATSIFNDNQPLIVIDGIPIDNSQNSTLTNVGLSSGGPVNGDVNQNRGIDINPDDIENISVLKGPSAAALYGSDASNGVIMITTKKGSGTGTKKFNVDISSSVSFDQVNKLPQLQSTYLQGTLNSYDPTSTLSWGPKKDTMFWDGLGASSNKGYDKNGNLVGKSDPTHKIPFSPYDNLNTFFKTGVTANNNFSISGGSDQGSFRLGISNLNQTGIIPLTKLVKTTATLSGEHKIGKIAVISGSGSYINSATDGTLSGNNTSAITYGLYRSPISFDNRNGATSVTDPMSYTSLDGSQRTYTQGSTHYDNPYFTINKNIYKSDLNRFFGNASLSIDPVKWFTIMGRTGVDVYSERHKQVFDLGSASLNTGAVIEDQYFNRIVNTDFMGTFHGTIFKDFNASLLIGENIYSSYSQNELINAQGLNFPGFVNVSNANTTLGSEAKYSILRFGTYESLNLDYKNQLYLNLTDRNDWSSTLLAGHRSFNYPSASLGWIFTETAKMSSSKVLPYGKIRASFADVGKASPYAYGLQKYYSQIIGVGYDGWTTGVTFPFNGLNGYQNNQTLNNPYIRPEHTRAYEAGLEMRFLQSMKTFGGFGFDVTYYYMLSSDGIVTAPVANSTGFAQQILNAGKVRNQGVELVASIAPVKTKDFRWDININWSKNISEVLAIAPGVTQQFIGGNDPSTYAVVGQPYGVIFGGDWLRDYKGNIVVDDAKLNPDGSKNTNYGLPLVSSKEKVIGDPNPKWMMGFRNTFTYKGLSLSLLFDIKHGGDIYDGTRGVLIRFGRAGETAAARENTVYSAGGVLGHVDANGNTVITGPNTVKVDMTAIYNNSSNPHDPNSGKSIAQLYYTGNGGGFGPVGSQFVEDGSFFRLRELSLAYKLPNKLFEKKKIFLKGIDIAFIARNLFLVTKYRGVDPDQSAAGASNVTGLEYFNLPATRSYGFNVKLHF
jgi:TonB-linked SusC/RagA family outer membrane protein